MASCAGEAWERESPARAAKDKRRSGAIGTVRQRKGMFETRGYRMANGREAAKKKALAVAKALSLCLLIAFISDGWI